MTGERKGQINLAFNQLKTLLLERIEQVGTVCGDPGLYPRPGGEVGVSQNRRIVAQAHDG